MYIYWYNISHGYTLNFTAASAAIETPPDCGVLSDFVAPSFGSLSSPPSLIVRNDLAYSISVYQIESQGNAPYRRYTLEPDSFKELGGTTSGVWIVTKDTDYIEPIYGQCYYIVDGSQADSIHLG